MHAPDLRSSRVFLCFLTRQTLLLPAAGEIGTAMTRVLQKIITKFIQWRG